HAHGARTNETPMPRAETHLAQLLHGAGYRLGHFGKNHCFTPEDFDACFDRTFLAGHGDRFEPGVTMVRSQLAPPRTAPPIAPPAPGRPAPPPAGYSEHWGFRRPTAHTRSEPREESATYRITEEACRYLEERHQTAPDEPLCLWVSLPDPHEPYQTPEPYASLYPPQSISLPPWPAGELEGKPERQQVYHHLLNWEDLSEADARLAMGIYYGMIAFVDERVGAVLDTLERLGMREDTIVVFCSDHGDFMGEHHMLIKCNAFYDCLTRVPLLLSYPRGIAQHGVRRPELVSLIDVMPTILRLVGLPVPAAVQGQPLPGTLDSPRSAPRSATAPDAQDALPPREAIFSEYGAGGPAVTLADARRLFPRGALRPLHPLLREREAQGHGKMVRTDRWKYTHDVTGEVDELYDLHADPWELTNLAGDPAQAGVVAELRGRLADWLLETENSRPVPLAFRPFWEGPAPPGVARTPDGGLAAR
ncbi:MAG TPA: sulfatase-like hydrolase/transferase, partial [Chloroflexota bacterium]|nr:sulfatase-like hydrolase/transferase [Chloroflexota bacterium]